jgi:HK97 family phage portal protein
MWPFKKKNQMSALSKYGSWNELFLTAATNAGVAVSNESALHISTVFACIRNISEDVAKIPIKVYRHIENGKERLVNHRLHYMLNYQPNSEMTSMDFRQTLTAHCLGWGNGYAEIQRDVLDNPVYLWPIHPSKVKAIRRDTGEIMYEVLREDGQISLLRPESMLHVRGLGEDGIVGHNVVRFARESLGLAKAAETFGATYFGNNTVMGGILRHPAQLSEAAQSRLKTSIERKHQGSENAHRLLVLEEGMEWLKTVIPPEESQFLETRQFSVPEICRWFRMPPHKVADLQRATFSNIEHQDLEYVKDCLTAWIKRWEQSIWWRLLSEDERRQGVYAEHTVEGLLRGDIASRYSAYQVALGNNNNPGFMTVNEVRALENLNPIAGNDELFSPQGQQEIFNEELQPDN